MDKQQVEGLAEIHGHVYYVSALDKLLVGLGGLGHYNNADHWNRGPWGKGANIGSIYVVDDHAKSRIGNCHITVGKVKLTKGSHRLTHQVAKADLIDTGDLCVCTAHSGDCFFSYELLYDCGGVLHVVEGMGFGAYAFGQPVGAAELLCVNRLEHFGVLAEEREHSIDRRFASG